MAMPAHRLLVVEDDPDLRSLLRRGLEEEGFAVAIAGNGAAALDQAGGGEPDALVVDIGLPDTDGRDLCQALRARGIDAPVLFLTARDALTDRIAGFDAGGDDYLTKPCPFVDLVARIRAVQHRSGGDEPIEAAGLRLDPLAHPVS